MKCTQVLYLYFEKSTCTYTCTSRRILSYLYLSTEKSTWYFYLRYTTGSFHVFEVSFCFVKILTVIYTAGMVIIIFNFLRYSNRLLVYVSCLNLKLSLIHRFCSSNLHLTLSYFDSLNFNHL